MLPIKKEEENNFFQIIVSSTEKGLISTIDEAYSLVESKYVYFIDSASAVEMNSYGLMERMKDVL